MADIGPDDLPFVPDASVSLIDMTPDPYTGRPKGTPTTGFHDWLGALWQKMKGVLVDLTTKVTTVTDQVGEISAEVTVLQEAQADLEGAFASYQVTVTAEFGAVNAAISSEASTRAGADSALATSITTVDAKANAATASGAVYLAAKAGPGGSTAAYGWYLTAGGAFAGMEALALSGGGSAIGFSASKFFFTDSGTAQQVLAYSGGSFVFQVPIVIQSATSGARTVITSSKIEVYDGSGALRVAIGVGI